MNKIGWALCLAALTSSAWAQTAPPTAPTSAPPGGERFAEHKQRILAHLATVTACVQAATNRQQIEACRAHHH